MVGYLGNALFQDLLVDVKETSSKGVPFDGAGGGNIFWVTWNLKGQGVLPLSTDS